ncbi:hypothetical protein NOS3756_55210 [Nostoc sp. NIES-3756]|uniref:hypothetical protein n=1 Tax=Nostoc sp. NIES-3756 TaxID=1751286 RepID=UPI000721F0A2|nr:hypothetical protein [Nostoc sp. NIES-3756]BAT56514.1 hypothetical protein NOS3756_55210 [Nostoc sp. NIES-3756]BAY35731.1 hypothetical protein NIES2111_00470 [Nostoc sp. NIES-2111]
MTIFSFLIPYHRVQKALQWWSYRHSAKLLWEAEQIRDGLLQETFTMRRNLDLLILDNLNLPNDTIQDSLKRVENFHYSLVKLSDRLFPESLQDSFPLAIESLVEAWLVSHPQLNFQIDMPIYWRHEPSERGFMILTFLQELLTVALSEVLIPTSIYLSLKPHNDLGKITVKIHYSQTSTFFLNSRLIELDYLSHSCQLLTSGKCIYHIRNLTISWCFSW